MHNDYISNPKDIQGIEAIGLESLIPVKLGFDGDGLSQGKMLTICAVSEVLLSC